MDIRPDYESVQEPLNRLVQIANAFRGFNLEKWPHYKNNEDFNRVYLLDSEDRRHFERVYSTGRDFAIALSEQLIAFNYPEEHPTLTSFVHSLDEGWLYELQNLEGIVQEAKERAAALEETPWAVWQMIELYEKQLQLAEAAKDTVENLKTTLIYKVENGLALGKETEIGVGLPWWKSFDRRIAVLGLIVAVASLVAAVAGLL